MGDIVKLQDTTSLQKCVGMFHLILRVHVFLHWCLSPEDKYSGRHRKWLHLIFWKHNDYWWTIKDVSVEKTDVVMLLFELGTVNFRTLISQGTPEVAMDVTTALRWGQNGRTPYLLALPFGRRLGYVCAHHLINETAIADGKPTISVFLSPVLSSKHNTFPWRHSNHVLGLTPELNPALARMCYVLTGLEYSVTSIEYFLAMLLFKDSRSIF